MSDPAELCRGSLEFLARAHRAEDALFPYSTSLRGDALVHDYEHRHARRYTINTLLGLAEARRHGAADAWLERVPELTDRFIELHLAGLESPADLGLAALLLAGDPGDARLGVTLARIERAAGPSAAR